MDQKIWYIAASIYYKKKKNQKKNTEMVTWTIY